MTTRFEFKVNTGASMHTVHELYLTDDVLDTLRADGDLGVESGMGALAVAQRIAYLVAKLAGEHRNELELLRGEAVEVGEQADRADALSRGAQLLDALVTHFNTQVIITKAE